MTSDERQLDAVLFDLDGTLVRTFIDFPGMRAAVREWAAHQGAEYVALANESDDTLEILSRLTQRAPTGKREEHIVAMNRILEEFEEQGCAAPEAIEGARELLHDLRAAGIRIGIVTRNCRRIAGSLLERMGLVTNTLIAREDTETFKPHPEPVLVACERLVVSPGRAAMVGDLWTDIAAGKAAGVRLTVGIQWRHDPPYRFQRCPPDQEVVSLREAGDLLRDRVACYKAPGKRVLKSC